MSYEGKPVQTETPCNSGYYFSSIIEFGETVFIDDIDEKCNALSKIFKHQANKDAKFTTEQANSVCVFKIVSTDFTGKQKPPLNAK